MSGQREPKSVLEEEYKISFEREQLKEYRFQGIDLLKTENLKRLLSLAGDSMCSPSPRITASLFAKQYSYMVIAAGLFTFIHHQKAINLSLPNLMLETDQNWNPVLVLEDPSVSEVSQKPYQDMFLGIFVENLQEIFRALNQCTEIHPMILWGHASYSVHYLFDKWLEESQTEEDRNRCQADLKWILAEIPQLNMEFKLMAHPLFEGKNLRLRNKCCLRYSLPDAVNCTTCPLINEKKRRGILREYHEKLK